MPISRVTMGAALLRRHARRSSERTPMAQTATKDVPEHIMDEAARQSFATHVVTSIEQLEAIYGAPQGGALVKEIDYVNAQYRALIEAAPFCAIATSGSDGLDCTPRGDPPGFVR